MQFLVSFWFGFVALTFLPYSTDTPRSTTTRCGVSSAANSSSAATRIVGGTAAVVGAWPWQIYIEVNRQFACGATLISEQWAVSACTFFLLYATISDASSIPFSRTQHTVLRRFEISLIIDLFWVGTLPPLRLID